MSAEASRCSNTESRNTTRLQWQRAYTLDDWIMFSDIGLSFDGVVLTHDEAKRVEDAYVAVAVSYLREAGVPSVTVAGLENSCGVSLSFGDGSELSLQQVGEVIPRMLREEFLCRLEGPMAFVHIGWDYYMYVGVSKACIASELMASRVGLFVETFRSPYRDACT